ncbi:MAG: site-specific integrase [Cyclobacteriaceae bacterium]|nr:site-specific integrase [Cyclobacteriaceae bacterium]
MDERLSVGRELVDTINSRLRRGAVFGKKKPTNQANQPIGDLIRYQPFTQALQIFVDRKKKDNARSNYLQRFPTIFRKWRAYLDECGREDKQIHQIKMVDIYGFLEFLQSKGIGNKTYNNYKTDLSIFFNWIIKRYPGAIKFNPVANIPSLRTNANKHAALSDKEIRMVQAKCVEINQMELLLFIRFIYYSLIRPGELRQLKIESIDLIENRIFVPASISKNRRDEFMPMAPTLVTAVRESGIITYPKEYFIFGKGGGPGLLPQGVLYLAKRNRRILEECKLTGKRYSIYSYKHSGAISLYEATKDIKLVQMICRHQTVDQTDHYLRDLGVLRDYQVLKDWRGPL